VGYFITAFVEIYC